MTKGVFFGRIDGHSNAKKNKGEIGFWQGHALIRRGYQARYAQTTFDAY